MSGIRSKLKKLLTADFWLDVLAAFLRQFIKRNPIGFFHKDFNCKHPYWSIVISLASIILIFSGSFYFISRHNRTQAAWWNESWAYRKSIQLTNNTTAQTNVYVSLTLSTSDTTRFQADCGDLRFTKSNGELLPYYIASGCGTASTVVHVNFDTFPAGQQAIYEYYGNPSADNGFASADFSTAASNYSVGTIGTEEKSLAPVAHWSFDEGRGTVAHDSTANRNDGALDTSYVSWKPESECVSGKCLDFDGTNWNSYVDAGPATTSEIGTSDLSISAWVKLNPAQPDAYAGIVTKGAAASNDAGYAFFYDVNNKILAMAISNGVGTRDWLLPWKDGGYNYTDILDNKWHHLAVSVDRDGDTSFYIDGQYIGAEWTSDDGDISAANIQNPAEPLLVGSWQLSNNLKGSIDEPKIYKYVRTADQIKQDYAAGLAGMGRTRTGSAATFGGSSDKWLTDGLIGYWKMDESSWNGTAGEVKDASGNNNNGTAVNGATTARGKFGNGGNYDGTDDYVLTPEIDVPASNTFSFAFWFKTTDSSFGVLASWGWVRRCYNNYGNLGCDLSGDNSYAAISPVATNDGLWHQGVFTVNNGAEVLYLDGKQVATYDGTLNTSSSDMAFGSNTSGGDYAGAIDDFRMYSRVLSPDEVQKLYEWAPGPVGWWKLDEGSGTQTSDMAGGNNATVESGAQWTQGKYGKALKFDGAESARVTNTAALSVTTGTVDFWFKSDVFSGWQEIVSKYDATTDRNGYSFQLSNDRIYAYICSATACNEVGGSTYLTLGEWYHGALTWDGTSIKLYLNGKLDGQGNQTLVPVSNVTDFCIGGDAVSDSWDFHGSVDDVRVYNYIRTQKQILEDMNAGTPGTSDDFALQPPVAEYKFDDGYGSTAHNSGFGGSVLDGTLNAGGSGGNTTATQMWDLSGSRGRSIEFDGTDDYVNVPDNNLLDFGSSDFSVSFWVYPKSNCSNWDNVWGVEKWNGGGSTVGENEWALTLCGADGNTNKAVFNIESGGTIYSSGYSQTSYSLNTWYHMVGVRSGQYLYLYMNGKKENIGDMGSVLAVNNVGRNLRVAFSDGNAYWTNALFDEVRIYNYALTPADVQADYNSGAAAKMGSSGTNTTTGAPTNAASGEYCVPGDTTSCAAPVGEWKMDEKSGTVAHDTSGNGNDGTIYNSTWTQGKFGSGLNFAGTSDNYVEAANTAALSLSSVGTVEAWFKANSFTCDGSSWCEIVSKCDDNIDSNGYILLTGGGTLCTELANGSNHQEVCGDTDLSTGRWYHGAITWDSTTVKIYVDGKLDNGSGTAQTIVPVSNVTTLRIGRSPTWNSGYWNGQIDQVRVYNYVRTPAQIAWDYNHGKPVAQWRFDECQGTTIHDESGNGNNGTLNLGASGQTAAGTCTNNASTAWYNGRAGKYNSSLNFDGTDDYVLGTSVGANIFASDSSISAWLKRTTEDSGFHGVLSQGEDHTGFWWLGSYSNVWQFYANNSSTPLLQSSSPIIAGNWYHVVVVRNSSNTLMYVNGVQVDSDSPTSTGNSENLYIGRTGGFSEYFDGLIDDIKIFNYALTPEQVKQLYNNGSAIQFGN